MSAKPSNTTKLKTVVTKANKINTADRGIEHATFYPYYQVMTIKSGVTIGTVAVNV